MPKDLGKPLEVDLPPTHGGLGAEYGLRIMSRYQQNERRLHSHNFSELVIIVSGSGRHVTDDGESYPLLPGDAFIIAPGEVHGYDELDALVLTNLCYDDGKISFADEDLRAMPGYHALFILEPQYRGSHGFKSRLRLNPEELAHVLELTDAVDDELERRDPGYRFMALTYFQHIVCYLSRCYGRAGNDEPHILHRLSEVISHLERNYTERLTLKDLTSVAHMSVSTLTRSFHRVFSLSPIDYLIRLRVSKAAELLRMDDSSVTDIAFEVGFTDSNYFSRQFRRIMGVSPSNYRSNIRDDDMIRPLPASQRS